MKCKAEGFRYPLIYKRSAGVTLIETMIALVVLAFIFFAIFAINRSTSNTYDVGKGQQDMQRVTARLISETSSAFMQGKLLSATPLSLNLLMPVDVDDDGDVLNDSYQMEWGAVDGNGAARPGYSINYTFAPSASGTTYSESALDIDFNEDGDKSDTFALGLIQKQLLDVTGTVRESVPISPENVLFAAGSPIFTRIDDTGAADGDGKNVRISFIVRYVDKRNNIYSRTVRTTVSPRNPTE